MLNEGLLEYCRKISCIFSHISFVHAQITNYTATMKTFCFALIFLLASIVGAENALRGRYLEAAGVFNGYDCVFKDTGLPLLYSTNSNIVFTNNKRDNFKLTCRFDIPEYLHLDQALRGDGFECGYTDPTDWDRTVYTTNTHAVGTPGGKIIMTCLFNGSN
jgi:hypothetical protein